jgi:hypothetical protein
VLVPTAGADAGKIEITYDAYGTPGPRTDVLIDVVGYTTSTGLVDLTNRLVALEAKQPRIASSAVNGFPTLSNDEALTTVTITVPAGGNQNVYIEGAASIFTNSTQLAACTSAGFCNVGIEIWDADTNTLLAPALNGAFYRLRDDNDGQSLSISAVVSASPGTHTYRLQTDFFSVVDNATFLNNAELTAMTVPLGGTGVAPASITGSSSEIVDDSANVAVAD